MEITKGNTTSEYKVTLIAQLVGMVLVSVGLVDPLDVDELSRHIMLILGSLGTIFTSIMYIYSRTMVKTNAPNVTLELQELPTVSAETNTVG